MSDTDRPARLVISDSTLAEVAGLMAWREEERARADFVRAIRDEIDERRAMWNTAPIAGALDTLGAAVTWAEGRQEMELLTLIARRLGGRAAAAVPEGGDGG